MFCTSGKTTFGSAQASITPDIVLYGPGVDECHCYLFVDGSSVTLYPLALLTSVGGLPVSSPTLLHHGMFQTICLLCFYINSQFSLCVVNDPVLYNCN